MAAFRVVSYSSAALADLLVDKSHGKSDDIRKKTHLRFLDEYFTEIGAATIVVEERYIDRDYLEDYAAYYARCFADYGRICARLHFFREAFDEACFEGLVRRTEPGDKIRAGYLGFIVVKPLPLTVIGRTCLVNYPNVADRRREFPTVREEKVNLVGIDLCVRSLPFQEQDTDVAACASSALWSVFHGTGRLFQHAIPSPVQITTAAAAHSRIDERALPANNGLTAIQISDAIRSVGLEPHAVRGTDTLFLRIAASAYLRAGMPCMLLGPLVEHTSGGGLELGKHAMALNGFSYGAMAPTGAPGSGCLFRASTIDRIYCHDDQVGPFAKLVFDASGKITTSWSATSPNATIVRVKPENLIVPLYHKVRIPFTALYDTIVRLDAFLERYRAAGFLPVTERLIWDLYLTDVNTFRREIYTSSLPETERVRLLQSDYPRYLWRAAASAGNAPQFELLFDATDLLQGKHIIDVVVHEKPVCMAIAVGFQKASPKLARRGSGSVIRWFTDNVAAFQ